MAKQPAGQSTQALPATGDDPEHHGKPPKPSFWEWIVAACGLMLVGGAIGFLLHQAYTARATPPDVQVQVAGIQAMSHGYLVEIRVLNRGNATAAELSVEGTLNENHTTLETSLTTFDYVPARSERRGGLFFTHDPRQFSLQLTPKGYQTP